MKEEEFWFKTPYVLMNKSYIMNVYPLKDSSVEEKLNAITRLIIILTLLGYFITRNLNIVILGIISIMVIVGYYYGNYSTIMKDKHTKEGFGLLEKIELKDKKKEELNKELYNPRKNNPLMNVLLPEIQYIPDRKPAVAVHNEDVKKRVNKKTLENLDEKIFKDLGDDILFNQGMRDFHTNPATTIPNDQDAFAKFCYGTMTSCKDSDGMQCDSKNYRHILR